jgi:hypothetical protein
MPRPREKQFPIHKHKVNNIEQAGFFWPMKEPWIMNIKTNSFDLIVLHKSSAPTHALS